MSAVPAAPIYLTSSQCQSLLTSQDVIEQIERVVGWDAAGKIRWPSPRNMNMRDAHENHYHLKACILEPLGIAGFRVVAHLATDENSCNATRYVVVVDTASSRTLAFVDETWSYAQRTVASIVMAAKKLALPEAGVLALVGAGNLATTALEYYSKLFNLREVRVVSRRPQTRETLARLAESKYKVPAQAMDSIQAAVHDADLVLTATNSGKALIEADWIAPGAVVATLDTAEPGRAYAEQADLFVVDSREQLQKELIELFGQEGPGWVDATVAEVVGGKHPGRTDAKQRALIVTQGMASQDVALAHLAYTRACDQGLGMAMPEGGA